MASRNIPQEATRSSQEGLDLRTVNIGTTMRSCELLARIIPYALAWADEHGQLENDEIVELQALQKLLGQVQHGDDVINDFLI